MTSTSDQIPGGEAVASAAPIEPLENFAAIASEIVSSPETALVILGAFLPLTLYTLVVNRRRSRNRLLQTEEVVQPDVATLRRARASRANAPLNTDR